MRDLLLYIEDNQGSASVRIDARGGIFEMPKGLEAYSSETLRHNIDMLIDKNFIISDQKAAFVFEITRLTADGSEFLASVRDAKNWAKTKEGAAAAGGFTIDLLKELAKGFIKKQIEERTGVPL